MKRVKAAAFVLAWIAVCVLLLGFEALFVLFAMTDRL